MVTFLKWGDTMDDISRIVDKVYTKIVQGKQFDVTPENVWAVYTSHAVRRMELAGKNPDQAWGDVVGAIAQTPAPYREEAAFQLFGTAGDAGEMAPYANAAVNIMAARGIKRADAANYVSGMIELAKPADREEMAKGMFLLAAKMNGEGAEIVKSYRNDSITDYVRPQRNTVRLANMTPEMIVRFESGGIDGHVGPYKADPKDSHHYEHWNSA